MNGISHSLVKRLHAVPDFASLDDRTLLRIVGASANLFWRAGSTIFDAGSEAEGLFIVISGRVQILESGPDGERPVAEIGPDTFFGEMALLRHATHSRSAKALEDTEIMLVRRDWFETLLESEPELAGYFHRLFEERVAGFGAEASPAPSTKSR